MNVSHLQVKCSFSSEQIYLSWSISEKQRNVKFVMRGKNLRTGKLTIVDIPDMGKQFELPIATTSGEKFEIRIQMVSADFGILLAEWSKEVRAEFTSAELLELYKKCLNFVKEDNKPSMVEITQLYRCKPKEYWDEICNWQSNIMKTYSKDKNGHRGNLINGKINGLFFSGRLIDWNLPKSSPFGDVRMDIDCISVLHPERHNLYFADFYCNKEIHYVTVVVCITGTHADRYCRKNLIKLDTSTNLFIRSVPNNHQCKFYINNNIWIEILYTEDINLNGNSFTSIRATGKGSSNTDGVPNNKSCTICNLYPV